MKSLIFTIAAALPALIHAQATTIADCIGPDGGKGPCCKVDGKLIPCFWTSTATVPPPPATTTVTGSPTVITPSQSVTASTIFDCVGPDGGLGPCCKVDGKVVPCFWTSTATSQSVSTPTASTTIIADCIGPNGGKGPCCKVGGKLIPCFWTSTTSSITPTPTPSEVSITTVITVTQCPVTRPGPCHTTTITTCLPNPPASTTLSTSCNSTVLPWTSTTQTPVPTPSHGCKGNCTVVVPTGGLPHTPSASPSGGATPPPYLGAAADMVPHSVVAMGTLFFGVVAAAMLM